MLAPPTHKLTLLTDSDIHDIQKMSDTVNTVGRWCVQACCIAALSHYYAYAYNYHASIDQLMLLLPGTGNVVIL